MATPPPLPVPRQSSLAVARTLNLTLPGLGLFYLGQRGLGLALAIPYLGCFGAEIVLFLISYARYLQLALEDDILKGDKIERIGGAFPLPWLAGLAFAGLGIYVLSMICFAAAKRKLASPSPAVNSAAIS